MKAFYMTNSTPLEDPRGSVQSDSRVYSTMTAFNVMNPNVVSVGPDVSINQIARTLVENGISAVPVVDESGAPVGMVSEGDLIPRREVAARGAAGLVAGSPCGRRSAQSGFPCQSQGDA